MTDITTNSGAGTFTQKVKKIDVDEETQRIAQTLYDPIANLAAKIIDEKTEINNFKQWYEKEHTKEGAWAKKVSEYKFLGLRTSGQEYKVILFSELRKVLNKEFEEEFDNKWDDWVKTFKEKVISDLQSQIPTISTLIETKPLRKELKKIEKKIKKETMHYCKKMNKHYKPQIHMNKIHIEINELVEDYIKKIKKEAIKSVD